MDIEELLKAADSHKFSCHASSIIDTESLTEKVSELSVSNNKVRSLFFLIPI